VAVEHAPGHAYQRRRPELSALHRLVASSLVASSLGPLRERLARESPYALTGRGLHDKPVLSVEPPEEQAPSVDLLALCRVPRPSDPARARRLDWAQLLRRAFAVDVLVCPRCQGPMRLVCVIETPTVIRRILGHLGLYSAPTRAGPRLAVATDLLDEVIDADDGVDRPAHLD
jgi:hypothetical protein